MFPRFCTLMRLVYHGVDYLKPGFGFLLSANYGL